MESLPAYVRKNMVHFRHGVTLRIENLDQPGVRVRWGHQDDVIWDFDRALPTEADEAISIIARIIALIKNALPTGLVARLDNIYHTKGVRHMTNMWNAINDREHCREAMLREVHQPWTIQLQVIDPRLSLNVI